MCGLRYFLCLCWIIILTVLPYCLGLRIPLFMTPLKALPQPITKTSSFYKTAEQDEFFSRVTAWDVWKATNVSVSGIYNSSVHDIISRANVLYQKSIFKTEHLNGYQCGSYCYALNISYIEYYTGRTRKELNGQTRPAITLGGLHEAVVKTLNDHFCITMSSIEDKLGISSFNVTLREWKLFLPDIAWYAIQCRADLLVVSRSELTELVRNNETTLLNYSLAQLDSELIRPYQRILSNKKVFERHELKNYVTANDNDDNDDDDNDEDDGSGNLNHWTSYPLHYYTKLATDFSIRDLQILYSWNSTQLYALQFVNLKSYDSCNDAISLSRTMHNISQSILEDISCPVALVLSTSVGYVQTKTHEIENPLELSALTIFTRVTEVDWIEIAEILEVNYTDGIFIDTPRLREIIRDNIGFGQDDILDLSVPQIIANYISLDPSVYVYENYAPMFNDMLTTYGFTPKELSRAYGQTIADLNRTVIITVHEWLLKAISNRYDVHNIAHLIGYTEHFPKDSDLSALPSSKWPEIIDAVIQQSFKQAIQAFSYDLQTNPDSVLISSQPDNFKTIETTAPSSFSNVSINHIASCLFKKTNNSFNSDNFRDYHRFYNNTIAKTMMKKILFETKSLKKILSQEGLSLKELNDISLSDSITTQTGFKLFEIECLYGESIRSAITGITWGDVSKEKLCYSFTNLTLLQIVTAVRDAPTVDCDADVDECSEQSPCHSHATCQNTIGSYMCRCKDGYVGNGVVCADKDECAGQSSCHSDATCQNTVGSYTCSCKPGFSGNGKTKCTGSSNSASSSNSNTGVIIGGVAAAVVVLVTVIVIVACILYRRMPPTDKERNIGEVQNPAYVGENQRNRRLPQVPYSESGYEEPVETAEYTQLDSSKRVPIDANYQSLKHRDKPGGSSETGDYAVLGKEDENDQRYASLGVKPANNLAEAYVTVVSKEPGNEAAKESLYEELP